MKVELFEIEERFQPFLLNKDYTFVGPVNPQILTKFYEIVNKLAPTIAISRLIHHALINKNSVKQALSFFPEDTELKIYVVVSNGSRNIVFTSIQEYCEKNKIEFTI